jgi:glycosyltransferase involved in cell wall biosynthesis
VDSSTDQTPQVALAHGAEILKVPRRGLGRAYIDAMPYVRGKYILMGDADLTYDLREIKPFIEKLKEGFEFVMGSRLLGYVEPGAMPRLHQYFGTPVTTWILNLMYGTHFSDIHCGMRAMTLDALKRINLEAQSWEYASEMVLKSAKLNLSATEVPIRFYKDRKGRVSHHRRSGWFSPWRAGWLNLKLMFIYAPDFFLWKPGWFLFVLGLLLTISLARGPYSLASIGLNLHWMLLGLTLATLGYSAIQLAILSRVFYNFNPLFTEKMCRLITYNRGIWMGITLDLIGVSLNLVLLIHWISSGLRLVEFYHPGIFGLLLISLGFQTFTFTLLFQMIVRSLRGCAK